MKKFYTCLIAFFCLVSLIAQPGNDKIETLVDSIVQVSVKSNQPGVAVGIIQNGEIVFIKGYGVADLEFDTPVNTGTKFNLASCSKQFTAACCLLLEKEGKLNFDEDIHEYLPELPDFGHKITVRMLMHHTSGIPSTDFLQLFAGKYYKLIWDQDDEFNLISRYAKLNFLPNAEYLYSNSGYFLMAKIVEKCSGKSFNNYLQDAICQPLGMKNTEVYYEPGLIIKNRSTGYVKKENHFVERFSLESNIIGSTNQYVSIADMMAWDKALLNGEFLGKETTSRIFIPVDTLNNGDTIKYTCGFNIWKYKGEKIAEHSGLTSGFVSRNHIFPERNFAVVALANCESTDLWGIAGLISDRLMGLKDPPRKVRTEVPIEKSLLSSYAGSYQMSDGMRFNTEMRRDTLWLIVPGAPLFRLVPEDSADFFIKEFDAQCTFSEVVKSKSQKITWHQSGSDHQGVRAEATAELTDNEKQSYTGNYRNEILDVTYPVFIKDNQIYMRLPDCFPEYVEIPKEISLIHLSGDKFYVTRLGIIEFQRNSKKMITGLTFRDVGRVRNIEFLKAGNG
jgi:CubicO group peptidase (beta-lactamase class C family)